MLNMVKIMSMILVMIDHDDFDDGHADHDSDDKLQNIASCQPVKVQELWGEEKAGPVFDLSKKIII